MGMSNLTEDIRIEPYPRYTANEFQNSWFSAALRYNIKTMFQGKASLDKKMS